MSVQVVEQPKTNRKLIKKTACPSGNPNCRTYHYDNGDVECVMYLTLGTGKGEL